MENSAIILREQI